ncbi:MAG: hypothetical protein OEY01_02025 [Desulfobulbaceae bacterium]|nr:hypothetical protein [Desulfobulbaceae bacterium]HIJ78070.1 hypothetical protein [Deltaproteobacteria bacterium]
MFTLPYLFHNKRLIFLSLTILALILALPITASRAADTKYSDSAHGSLDIGVCRPDICTAATPNGDYAKGNCANCHELHASIEGVEPATPSPFTLFTTNFDIAYTGNPYDEATNICFTCHNSPASIQTVTNNDYATTFGDYTGPSANSILAMFNQTPADPSYHNLYDIWVYAKNNFTWFKESSNPCVACHNPHLAKRNNSDPTNPTLTSISRPTDHENLWGDDDNERMSAFVSSSAYTYQPPYRYQSTTTFEPTAEQTPDYVTFCLDCHQNQVYSTALGGNLKAINWDSDIHGKGVRYNNLAGSPQDFGYVKPPYWDGVSNPDTPANYVLSCVNCHEPHATVLAQKIGINLIRKEINGWYNSLVENCNIGVIDNGNDWCERGVCEKCHATYEHQSGKIGGCFGCHGHGLSVGGGGSAMKTF